MNRPRALFLLVAAATISMILFATGCSSTEESTSKIVTTFYPLEYVANQIAGGDFEVVNLTPLGAEPHDLELSPSNTSELLNAKLAIVMGKGFQPAIEKTAKSRDGSTLEILDSIKTNENDPHVWLDPVKMKKVVELVDEQLSKINPDKKEKYDENANKLITKLDSLDKKFKATFQTCELSTFITSHEAFSQLADRYGLKQVSIAGFSPENEPTPKRLKQISKIVREDKISIIFTEELVSKKVADTLSSQIGVQTQILSPIEGLTQKQVDNGDDYFTLMESNLQKLAVALRCSPRV